MATPAGQGWVEVLVGLGGGGQERKRSEAEKVQGWRGCFSLSWEPDGKVTEE